MFNQFADFFQMGMPPGGMFPGSAFRRDYRCYSAVMFPNSDRQDVEKGDKIIMPPSALDMLSRIHVQYPMMFKLSNASQKRSTHCGVLEFVADEGLIYAPAWMMRNLLLDEGDIVSLQSISLPVATYSKFQPQSTDFLDITDPRAVLESALRGFACLTVGDIIAIEYNTKIFEMLVLEARPANAVTIIECDMQVEFSAPIGYKEPERVPKKTEVEDEPMMIDADAIPSAQRFEAFAGAGQRLGGNKKKASSSMKEALSAPLEEPSSSKKRIDVTTLSQKGIPNYDWRPGKLTFRRNLRKPVVSESDRNSPSFSAFSGAGFQLKKGLNKP